MNDAVEVDSVMFYTRSQDAHNRQLVAVMTNGKVHRFSEGKMREEMLANILPDSTFRAISDAAYDKAMTFRHDDDAWTAVQKLLCEFQIELDELYD